MPDATLKTVSATQSPALFGVSPYVTKWMLYRHFHDGVSLEIEDNARLKYGRRLQPLILEDAAQELALEVTPNTENTYIRRGLLGCTPDANVVAPDRGPGRIETKAVFDYGVWMREWDGGRTVPRHHDIQLQQQMYVGDEKKPFEWGIIIAWVCGDLYYFERQPIPELWERLETEAAAFLADVAAGNEPDPFGAPVEIGWLTKLLPVVEKKVRDLRTEPGADKLVEAAVQFNLAKDVRGANDKLANKCKAELLGAALDAEEVLLPSGVKLTIKQSYKRAYSVKESTSKLLTVYVPGVPGEQSSDLIMAG
jgi:hypothetical protein